MGRSLALVGAGAFILAVGILIAAQVIVVPHPTLFDYVTQTILRFIVTSQGDPVEGAQVHVRGNSGDDVVLYTDSQGFAETVVSASKDYTVTVTKTGYRVFTESFSRDIGTVMERLDIDLEEGEWQQLTTFDQTLLGAATSVAGVALIILGFEKDRLRHLSYRGTTQ